jgi:beta-lactamase superfamily II metal-dependent hydrolase
MDALQEHNVTVYRTDLQGSIVVKSNGETITITTEK